MRILVYGVGAIGSLMVHYLCKAGNDVTIIARSTYDELKNNGLVIRHHLQKKTTASLDAENESVIQEALSRLIKDKTVLIIAHRMRTVANADHIVVLKDGVVAEEGSPDELDAKDSIYKHMKEQQLISANWKM